MCLKFEIQNSAKLAKIHNSALDISCEQYKMLFIQPLLVQLLLLCPYLAISLVLCIYLLIKLYDLNGTAVYWMDGTLCWFYQIPQNFQPTMNLHPFCLFCWWLGLHVKQTPLSHSLLLTSLSILNHFLPVYLSRCSPLPLYLRIRIILGRICDADDTILQIFEVDIEWLQGPFFINSIPPCPASRVICTYNRVLHFLHLQELWFYENLILCRKYRHISF